MQKICWSVQAYFMSNCSAVRLRMRIVSTRCRDFPWEFPTCSTTKLWSSTMASEGWLVESYAYASLVCILSSCFQYYLQVSLPYLMMPREQWLTVWLFDATLTSSMSNWNHPRFCHCSIAISRMQKSVGEWNLTRSTDMPKMQPWLRQYLPWASQPTFLTSAWLLVATMISRELHKHCWKVHAWLCAYIAIKLRHKPSVYSSDFTCSS